MGEDLPRRIVQDLLRSLDGIIDKTERSLRISSRLNFWDSTMGDSVLEDQKEQIFRYVRIEVESILTQQEEESVKTTTTKDLKRRRSSKENDKSAMNQKEAEKPGPKKCSPHKHREESKGELDALWYYGPSSKQATQREHQALRRKKAKKDEVGSLWYYGPSSNKTTQPVHQTRMETKGDVRDSVSHYGPSSNETTRQSAFPEISFGDSLTGVSNRIADDSHDNNQSSEPKTDQHLFDGSEAVEEISEIKDAAVAWDDLPAFQQIMLSKIQEEYRNHPHCPLQMILDRSKSIWKQSADQRGLEEETFEAMWLGIIAQSRSEWKKWTKAHPMNWAFLVGGSVETTVMVNVYYSGMDIDRTLDV